MGSAQTATEEALANACICFETTARTEVSPERLIPLTDSCLSEGLYVNLTGVLREQGGRYDNDSSLYAVAQYLHEELSRSCPGFRQMTHALAAQQLEMVKTEHQQTRGLIYEYNDAQQFPVIVLLTESQQLEHFLWLREFDGSTRFMDGVQPYRFTRLLIVWQEVELYDRVTRNYRLYKEILLIEEESTVSSKERRAQLQSYKRAIKGKDK